MTNAKLTGNEAGLEGGAVYNVGQFLATRSVFADNIGGAVVTTGSATLASSLVLANEGENALAAFGVDSSLFLVNVTAVGNVGGVYASEGALTIYNSIIGGTVAQDDAAFDAKYSKRPSKRSTRRTLPFTRPISPTSTKPPIGPSGTSASAPEAPRSTPLRANTRSTSTSTALRSR